MASIKTTPARPSAQRYDAAIDAPPPTPRDRDELIFGRQTFLWIAVGIGLMALGMLLMAGGGMPSPDVWDESLIYSFRRITLAPIVIISGLGVITYAIFKK